MKDILLSTLLAKHICTTQKKKNEFAEKVHKCNVVYQHKVTYFDVGPYLIRKTILFKGLMV